MSKNSGERARRRQQCLPHVDLKPDAPRRETFRLLSAERRRERARKALGIDPVRYRATAPTVEFALDQVWKGEAPATVVVRSIRRKAEKVDRKARKEARMVYTKPPKRSENLLPDDVFSLIMRLQGERCYICRKVFTEGDWATMDHVIPTALGGFHGGGNILLACFRCNNVKADRAPKPCEMLYLAGIKAMFVAALGGTP